MGPAAVPAQHAVSDRYAGWPGPRPSGDAGITWQRGELSWHSPASNRGHPPTTWRGHLGSGCGSGVLDRWLARYTKQANRIIGVDVNRYLLREATALAMQEDLADVLKFQEGNAEALPFPDNHVEVAVSFTVLEEGNADRMLAELVRVEKPGGRVAVMVRALDIPWVVNVPLRAELKTKTEIPRGFVGAQGCADASLYRRFHQAELSRVQMWPQFAAFESPTRRRHSLRTAPFSVPSRPRKRNSGTRAWHKR